MNGGAVLGGGTVLSEFSYLSYPSAAISKYQTEFVQLQPQLYLDITFRVGLVSGSILAGL